MKHYQAPLSVIVAGPFLVGGTSVNTYGLDLTFHRDWHGRLAIPASQIKGALRSSLSEIGGCSSHPLVDIPKLFGQASGDTGGDYAPKRALLAFSDLVCQQQAAASTRPQHRVTIDTQSGTAAHRKLRTIERPFASGEPVTCAGRVLLWADSDQQAKTTLAALQCGLRWMTALGGQRGVGYGHLLHAQLGQPEKLATTNSKGEISGPYHLAIFPLEPLLVGGVKLPKSNMVTSEMALPGGLIKGALAAGLNRAHGGLPGDPLDASTAGDFSGFEDLITHYDKVRISHAFPSAVGSPRPTRVPFSTVEIDGEVLDSALSSQASPILGDLAPTYQPDWKKAEPFAGAATPRQATMTRTRIDSASRRAAEGSLFTELAMAPETADGLAIHWLCDVYVDTGDDFSLQNTVISQLAQALSQHLLCLGKGNRRIRTELRTGKAEPALAAGPAITEGIAIVSLQTDAVILAPDAVRDLPVHLDLGTLYAQFWFDISKGSLEMEDFWAKQVFKGGYLYHRYLGRHDNPKHYQPYYLTQAGSTFRLKVKDEVKAQELLKTWQNSGLPLPDWAQDAYHRDGQRLWQTCPFVPENGYGEIAVNLDRHWERRMDAPMSDSAHNPQTEDQP